MPAKKGGVAKEMIVEENHLKSDKKIDQSVMVGNSSETNVPKIIAILVLKEAAQEDAKTKEDL